MKLLILLVCALICVGYFVVNRQVRADIQAAIANNTATMGMTEAETKMALGEPLARRSTQDFFGTETVQTFADGNEITFRRGKATKIQTVAMTPALVEVKKAREAKAARSTPEPKRGEWMWKNHKNPLDEKARK